MRVLLDIESGPGRKVIERAAAIDNSPKMTGERIHRKYRGIITELTQAVNGGMKTDLTQCIAEILILIKQLQLLSPAHNETILEELDKRLITLDTDVTRIEGLEAAKVKKSAARGRRNVRRRP